MSGAALVRWLLSHLLHRALVALALFCAYRAWGESLQPPIRQIMATNHGLVSPFEAIARALDPP